MQLHPQETFTIVRQIEDHTDTNTYYVRAVIRNAKTDAILSTVNLTDRGDRRFAYEYRVPADVSGQGFWIVILTTVYTDAAYTTKSENYGEKMDTYLVQDRYNSNLGGGGGGGPDIDYKKIRKIVHEEVEKVEIPEVIIPPYPVIDLRPLERKIDQLPTSFPEFPSIPVSERVDLSPIMESIAKVKEQIDALPKDIPETDLSSIEKSLDFVTKQTRLIRNDLNFIDLGKEERKEEPDDKEVMDHRVMVMTGRRPIIRDERVNKLLQ